MRIGSAFLGCSLLLLIFSVSAAQKQPPAPVSGSAPNPKIVPTYGNPNPANDNINSGHMGTPDTDSNDVDLETLRRQRLAKVIAAEYQKKNLADSEKLLALAKDLSAECSAPGSAGPGAGDMDKAKEIEKLAKRMKQRLIQIQ